MQIKLTLVFMALLLSVNGYCQNQIIDLWEGAIPNYLQTNEIEEHEIDKILWITNVQKPTLAVYLPSKGNANGMGVLICPGGGYHGLAYDWEGIDIAKWFNSKGIAAFVLKYRLPISKSVTVDHETPLLDAQQALRIVRNNAESWNVSSNQIGIIGFSAGGHLASSTGTHFRYAIDSEKVRPDFMILVYPVITMDKAYTHMGSRVALLGDDPDKEIEVLYSNEFQVTKATPPTILIHSMDDDVVSVKNSLLFYERLINAGVPTEMHLYPEGGHGYSLALDDAHLSTWPSRVHDWLKQLKFKK